MPTTEERYRSAVAYTRQAIDVVESQALRSTWIPLLGAAEWYANRTKTEHPRAELSRIEDKWLRATSTAQRDAIAREAELLADRVQENLPGAPQSRARTNLGKSEEPMSTPTTSYTRTIAEDASDAFAWVKRQAADAADTATSLSGWLLAASAVALGWQIVDALQRRAVRDDLARAMRRADVERDE